MKGIIMVIDQIDFQILRILTENSRIQWKDLGKQIHMTGQAVGNRIKKLEESGLIQSYSVIIDDMKLGLAYTAFIIVYMESPNHGAFVRFMENRNEIVEAHRISGEGCYHLKIKVESQDQLNLFLNQVLKYGNYRLNLSIQEIVKRHPLTVPNEES